MGGFVPRGHLAMARIRFCFIHCFVGFFGWFDWGFLGVAATGEEMATDI